MSSADRYSFDNAWDKARQRLAALEARFDAGTIAHLDSLGVARGWSCLEVGAGGGSVALWLCAQVGPSGRVLATDLDIRHLEGRPEPNLTVRRHDVVVDPLPSNEFDLVHARAVLAHLPGRKEVLAKLVAALRPGGWLVCEDLDGLTIGLASPDDAESIRVYDRVEAAVAAAMAGHGHDYSWGRRLPAELAAAGLVEVGAAGRMFHRRPGPESTTARLTVEQLRRDLVDSGDVTETEVEGYLELLENPRFLARTAIMIAAWGRRPA